ncbi:MAG: tetratricopeptide repeat protein [Chloroflexi bacterium]|nr:tetratricopeptide repeat protein [Chloroflexota bacterium]
MTEHNNLPIALTRFIGREKEIAEVKRLLTSPSSPTPSLSPVAQFSDRREGGGKGVGVRLLTLTGSGGCGKTRLAIQVADSLRDKFPDGVWLIELGSLADSALVSQTVASVFDLRQAGKLAPIDLLKNFLRAKNVLLVLDNCEHLIHACAQLAESLLTSCPDLKILATSREALNIAGESLYRVPSLTLPPTQDLPALDILAQYESIHLFVERADAIAPRFELTRDNAPFIAQICQRVDGIPLAIELAAARVKMLTVAQIAARLDNVFRLLTRGSINAMPRQQTLRATMDWSFDLLSEPERILFRRLAVFAGGFTLDQAEVICAGDGLHADDMLDVLADLVDKSLVSVFKYEEGAAARYRMLETIRQYASEKMTEAGEAYSLRARHLDFFLQVAEETEPKHEGSGANQRMNHLHVEYDNLRVALKTAHALGLVEPGLRLASALGEFWETVGYLSEARATCRALLSLSVESRSQLGVARVRVLNLAGYWAILQGDYAEAHQLLEESTALAEEIEDDVSVARSLKYRSFAALTQGDNTAARALVEKSLAILRQLDDQPSIAISLTTLGLVVRDQGDYARARTLFEEALAIRRALNDRNAIASSLRDLGSTAQAQGDPIAEAWLESSLKMSQELNDQFEIPRCLHDLGLVAASRGDTEHAQKLFSQSLAIFQAQGDKRNTLKCIEGLAGTASANGRHERATRLLGAAEVLRETLGVPMLGMYRARHTVMIRNLHDRLESNRLAIVWAEGRAMSLEQAIQYAFGEAIEYDQVELAETRQAAKTKLDGLTARECEVAALIAVGKSNRAIAEVLVLSERTVEGYVGNILNKLGFNARTQIAAWAVQRGLVQPDKTLP